MYYGDDTYRRTDRFSYSLHFVTCFPTLAAVGKQSGSTGMGKSKPKKERTWSAAVAPQRQELLSVGTSDGTLSVLQLQRHSRSRLSRTNQADRSLSWDWPDAAGVR